MYDVLDMTVDEARGFFSKIPGLARKLDTLHDVGLGYIRLGQPPLRFLVVRLSV